MKAPISWLKDFVDIDVTPEVLASKLVSAGFEVEEIIYNGKDISGVVVGLVTYCEAIPDTHLHLCRVNCGKYGVFQICCGADNVEVGKKFPTAMVGATVYQTAKDHVTVEGVMTINPGKLRGYDSFGMLCSGAELGVTEDMYPGASYNGLLVLPDSARPGDDVKPIVGLDEAVLDVSVTANRPDCNSIVGIAREVAAVTGKTFKPVHLSYRAEPDRISNYLTVSVKDKELCPRYVAKMVKNVKVGPSPAIIQKRLRLVGHKPINNIVDITNYVLTEIGQPMHAFDYDALEGAQLIVRRAASGEEFVDLYGGEHTLSDDMLVIADAAKPLALAGVMGGINSGIFEKTDKIVFESARFKRDNVRRTARKTGLRSDSSARFEKGIDYVSQELGINRALTLIDSLHIGTIISGTIDSYAAPVTAREIKVKTKDVNEILGIKVPYKRMVQILDSVGILSKVKGKQLVCQVPPHRDDVQNANDVAEEVIRLYGYNKIKSTMFKKAQQTKGGKTPYQHGVDKLKESMRGLGANETLTYSFISPKDYEAMGMDGSFVAENVIKIINPLGEDVSLMRTSMLPSMMKVVSTNVQKGNKEGFFFEVARVFVPKQLPLKELPTEPEKLAIVAYGTDMDFFKLKGVVEAVLSTYGITDAEYKAEQKSYMHPGRSATVSFYKGKAFGELGEIHPATANAYGIEDRVYFAELDVKDLLSTAVKVRPFVAAPKYPASTRDLAFVVKDSITAAELIKAIKKCTDKQLLESVEVFDVYKGTGIKPGYMSIAFNLTFRSATGTLKDDVVNGQIDRILRSLRRKFRARLR